MLCCDHKFTWITWTRIHKIELKWNLISCNAENCFRVWIFREYEFTDYLFLSHFTDHNKYYGKGSWLVLHRSCSGFNQSKNTQLMNGEPLWITMVTILKRNWWMPTSFQLICSSSGKWYLPPSSFSFFLTLQAQMALFFNDMLWWSAIINMTFKVLAESLLENVHQTCQFFPNGPLEVMRGLHKQMLILFLSPHTNKKSIWKFA